MFAHWPSRSVSRKSRRELSRLGDSAVRAVPPVSAVEAFAMTRPIDSPRADRGGRTPCGRARPLSIITILIRQNRLRKQMAFGGCNPAKIQASVTPCSPTSRSLVSFEVREISPRRTQRFDCGRAWRIQRQQFLTENQQPCYFAAIMTDTADTGARLRHTRPRYIAWLVCRLQATYLRFCALIYRKSAKSTRNVL
jgi:hypothetical protein